MSSSRRTRSGWLAGVVLGLVVGTGAGALYHHRDTARAAADREEIEQVLTEEQRGRTTGLPAPTEIVREVIAGSREDSVVVVDSLSSTVTRKDLRRARAILDDADVPGHLVLAPSPNDGDLGYNNSSFAAMWMDGVGQDGHYVVLWTDGMTESAARGMDDEYLDTALSRGQPGQALVRIATEMATWPATPEYRPDWETRDAQDYWGGVGGGVGLVLLIGVFLVLPVFFAVRTAVGRRR